MPERREWGWGAGRGCSQGLRDSGSAFFLRATGTSEVCKGRVCVCMCVYEILAVKGRLEAVVVEGSRVDETGAPLGWPSG